MSTRTPARSADTVWTSLGCKVSYAWESTKNSRPAGGYEIIWDCTRSPSIGGEADEIETTPLTNKKNHTYTTGLQQLADKSILCNATNEVMAIHADMMTTKAANRSSDLCMWVCIDLENDSGAFYCRTLPADYSMASVEVNDRQQITIPLEIIGSWEHGTKPTSYVNDESI